MGEVRQTFKPLVVGSWGDEHTEPRRSYWTFKATYTDTLEKLEYEIAFLGAEDYVLEVAFTREQLRKDGTPRADARNPDFPGVRVAFDSVDHGVLVYQTDSCEFWQHNVRSIALGLEALRGVERYGISKRNQQYVGFKELGSGTAMGSSSTPTMTRGQAYELVYSEAGADTGSIVLLKAWKRAVRQAHPDSSTGSAERWEKLERAGHILGIS